MDGTGMSMNRCWRCGSLLPVCDPCWNCYSPLTVRAWRWLRARRPDPDGARARSESQALRSCTCLIWVDGLGDPDGRVTRNPECPIHGAASNQDHDPAKERL